MPIQSSTTDTARTSNPGEGPRIIGRYALHEALASGGMATVYLGRLVGPVGFSRTVAIKQLHPQFARDPEFVAMFLDEARVAARIRHPNVVPTLDVVATEGELFLVMDYVQGEALSQLFRAVRHQGARIPAPIAVNIVSGVLHGLHAAHEATNERGEALGIVHRDVSPQNILVGTDGVPRLVDFGVAKAVGRLQTTREGQLKGKAAYMAPEQVRGGEVTRQADVFAASVVLWEALAGRRLFQGNSDAETIYRLLDAPLEAPSAVAPDIPPALDRVVLRGLSRAASDRYASALEMAIDLEKSIGVVSSREVGAWVHETAGARLDARTQQVRAIEQSSSGVNLETLQSGLLAARSPDEPTSVVPLAARAGTAAGPAHAGSESTGRGLQGGRRTAVLAASGVGVALLIVLATTFLLRAPSVQSTTEPTASSTRGSVPLPSGAASTPPIQIAVPSTNSVLPVAVAPPASATVTPPVTTAKGAGRTAATATAIKKPPGTPGGLHGID